VPGYTLLQFRLPKENTNVTHKPLRAADSTISAAAVETGSLDSPQPNRAQLSGFLFEKLRREQWQRNIVVQVPLSLCCLGHVPPRGLARAGWLRLLREAAAIDPILAFVAALGHENGNTSAERTIAQDKFGDVDVAHGESQQRRRNRSALASFLTENLFTL
jgi:hypothetical protein